MSRRGRDVWVRFGVVVLLLGALGCGATYAVRHTVGPGDTVSSLARRYGVDEAELRQYNRLQTGDELRRGDVVFVPGAHERPARSPTASPPAKPRATAVPVPSAPAPPVAPPPSPPPAPSLPPRARAPLAWPADGEVLRGFGSGPAGDNRGIDIAAAEGTEVRAAGAGTVTYAGIPARAYGAIVLVEHADGLFTVYSQLAAAAVRKGAQVTRGEVVGRVAGGKPSHLHFEVRRAEKAVDPLLYLPPR